MASIGPQMPPSPTKRKRTSGDDGEADSPPSKRAPKNDDDTSEDEYGPSIPNVSSIGPSMPSSGSDSKTTIDPALPHSNTNEISLDDSDSDSDAGPAPGPASKPTAMPEASSGASKRVMGPAPPPAPLAQRPPGSPNSDSDSDDDYGPSLPSSNTHLARQSQALEAAALEAANPKAPKRDDWMVVPPTAGSARAADPTQIKARKFNSGPRAAAGGGGGAAGEISSIWTETPEQKRQRLENAVLGRGGTAGAGTGSGISSSDRRTKEEQAKEEQIRANLEAARGPSLYAAHQQQEGGKGGRIEAEEDDPSKRGFDWEKDMRSGSKIGTAQRRELMDKAADFGGRFSKGKYL
ncbi:putative DUF3752 domain-containing protein [Seiridium unicorne]|uniref:DUF3752 domain-containing protein n=1 Tax=Seiridium unicorne TaxID=138068 RepID=A0ABR2UKF0_9PEZI